jgi:hypothetical protein
MSETKNKPKVSSSLAQQELNKVEKQFEAFDENIKSLTLDRMNKAPIEEADSQTKMSQRDISKTKDIYLKPSKSVNANGEKFNEKFRKDYNFSIEYVNFIAENKEIIGETIEIWTKPFAGMPAEFWQVPVNKPVWGPRHLAEQIKRCRHHRLTMQDRPVQADGMGTYYGMMVVDNTVNRLDAHPVDNRKSIFTGSMSF